MLGLILAMIVTGLIVGALARLLLPGRDPMSLGGTMLLGIAGSLIGGLIARWVFGLWGGGLVFSVLGAVIVLWIYRGRRRPRAV